MSRKLVGSQSCFSSPLPCLHCAPENLAGQRDIVLQATRGKSKSESTCLNHIVCLSSSWRHPAEPFCFPLFSLTLWIKPQVSLFPLCLVHILLNENIPLYCSSGNINVLHPVSNEFIPLWGCSFRYSSILPRFSSFFKNQKATRSECLRSSFPWHQERCAWVCLSGTHFWTWATVVQLQVVDAVAVTSASGLGGWGQRSREGGAMLSHYLHLMPTLKSQAWGFWGPWVHSQDHTNLLEQELCRVLGDSLRDKSRHCREGREENIGWLTGTQKLCCWPRNVIIDMLATGEPTTWIPNNYFPQLLDFQMWSMEWCWQ